MTIEEAVVILKNAIKKPNTEDGYLGQALTMAIKTLEQQRWIPVSERLPPIGDEVIATTVWGEVTKAERYGSGNEDWFIHEGATNAKTEDILAWKLRPRPYKAESEDD